MTIGIQAFAELLDHSQKIAKFFMVLSIRLLDFIDGYLSRELICNAITLSCPSSRPVAQKTGDINGTSPSDLFQQLVANWEKQPPGPLLIIRLDAVCNHSVLVPYERFCLVMVLSSDCFQAGESHLYRLELSRRSQPQNLLTTCKRSRAEQVLLRLI